MNTINRYKNSSRKTKAHSRKSKVRNSELQQQKSDHDQQSPEQILTMQQTMGNQAVAQMITSGALRPKLTMGQPGDVYEQEADKTADKVMSMSAGHVQCQTDEENIQSQPMEGEVQSQTMDEEETVQGKGSLSSTGFSNSVASKIQSIKSGGQPLSASARAFFEPRFGADFSNVKIHNDAKAHETSAAINARAYTLGNHIAFGKGQYSPESTDGKRLMAHELTHVVQQGGAIRAAKNPVGKSRQKLPVIRNASKGVNRIQRSLASLARAFQVISNLEPLFPFINFGISRSQFESEVSRLQPLILQQIRQRREQYNRMRSTNQIDAIYVNVSYEIDYDYLPGPEMAPEETLYRIRITNIDLSFNNINTGQHFAREAPNKRFYTMTRSTVLNFETQMSTGAPHPIIIPNFSFDNSSVPLNGQLQLHDFGRIQDKNSVHIYSIEGYTDRVGSAGYNEGLSSRRARAVQTLLQQMGFHQFGTVQGFGERFAHVPVTASRDQRSSDRKVIIRYRRHSGGVIG